VDTARPLKPNFLFVIPDQLRLDALGAFGSPIAKTPSVDAFAATGIKFTQAYVPCVVPDGAVSAYPWAPDPVQSPASGRAQHAAPPEGRRLSRHAHR
jgi:hypothetical protein